MRIRTQGIAALSCLPMLAATAFAAPGDEAWVGKWAAGHNHITIHEGDNGMLKVSGDALWEDEPDAQGNPTANIGDVSGSGKPENGTLTIIGTADGSYTAKAGPSDCVVTLQLVGDRLIASDNARCGGMNVRFDGTYSKAGT